MRTELDLTSFARNGPDDRAPNAHGDSQHPPTMKATCWASNNARFGEFQFDLALREVCPCFRGFLRVVIQHTVRAKPCVSVPSRMRPVVWLTSPLEALTYPQVVSMTARVYRAPRMSLRGWSRSGATPDTSEAVNHDLSPTVDGAIPVKWRGEAGSKEARYTASG